MVSQLQFAPQAPDWFSPASEPHPTDNLGKLDKIEKACPPGMLKTHRQRPLAEAASWTVGDGRSTRLRKRTSRLCPMNRAQAASRSSAFVGRETRPAGALSTSPSDLRLATPGIAPASRGAFCARTIRCRDRISVLISQREASHQGGSGSGVGQRESRVPVECGSLLPGQQIERRTTVAAHTPDRCPRRKLRWLVPGFPARVRPRAGLGWRTLRRPPL